MKTNSLEIKLKYKSIIFPGSIKLQQTTTKSPPLLPPVILSTCWITKNIDRLSIKAPGVGDPRDGTVGVIDDSGGEGDDGGRHLLVIDCYLVWMSIGNIVNTMYEWVVAVWFVG